MIRKSVLGNGVRILSEKMPGVRSVSIGFWVQSGSRHEPSRLNGISHFLEHMLFKGCGNRSALDVARQIDRVGGALNGFTGREFSCFFAKVMTTKLPLAIDLLGDIILNPQIGQQELEKERQVVLQEIAMVEDNPDDHVHDLFCELFWLGHPLGLPTPGTAETVRAITRDDLCSFLAQRYRGDNLLICAAGEVDHEALVEQINSKLATLPSGGRESQPASPQPQKRWRFEYRNCEQVHLCLGTRGLAQDDPRRFAGYLLNTLLGGGMSSRLFQAIRDKRGLAYAIYSYLSAHSDVGSQVIYSAAAPENFEAVIELILDQCRQLREQLVDPAELEGAREQLKGALLLSLESTDNRMTRLAKNEIFLGRNWDIDEVLAGFDAVTCDGVRELAEILFRDESLNLQLLGRVDEAGIPVAKLSVE